MEVDGEHMEMDPLTEPIPAGAAEEEVDLEDVDHTHAGRAARAMDEDDDDGVPPGAERMQCASQ